MKLRADHLKKWQEDVEAGFVDRVVAYLGREHYETVRGISDDRLRQCVAQGIERSRRWQIESETGVMQFVALMFLVSPNFDEHPRVGKILSNPELPPDERIQFLLNSITRQQWQEIASERDSRAWKSAPRSRWKLFHE